MSIDFRSIIEIINTFDTEQKCIDFLEEQRWSGHVVSPYDSESKVYKLANNWYKCKKTGKFFNVRTGTLFSESKLSLRTWFTAIYLILTNKKGISSCQLSVQLNVTQKTAWFVSQRIRKCLSLENKSVLSKKVEVDEAYFGGVTTKDKYKKNVQGRSLSHKVPVLGMVQRGSKVVAKVLKNASSKSIMPNIETYIKKGSTIISDNWSAYKKVSENYIHETVTHSNKEYDKTKYIEGFWSIVKKGFIGTYQYISSKHLQLYIDEFVFRYNTMKLSVCERFIHFFNNMNVKTTYKNIVNC